MNRRTRSLRKQGLCTQVNKGVNGTGEGCPIKKGALTIKRVEIYKDGLCPTSFSDDPAVRARRGDKRKSPRGKRTVQRG